MQTICPYPGLRPFNEEKPNSFFKGREQTGGAFSKAARKKSS